MVLLALVGAVHPPFLVSLNWDKMQCIFWVSICTLLARGPGCLAPENRPHLGQSLTASQPDPFHHLPEVILYTKGSRRSVWLQTCVQGT